jgi:hypothetical protein
MEKFMQKFFSTMLLIFLIILIVVFRTEIFVIGVKIYASTTDSPRAEHMLGDYYRSSAQLNADYASNIFISSLEKYKLAMTKFQGDQESLIQLKIGQFYECGTGVRIDLVEAKRWYDEAQKNARKPELVTQTKEAVDRVTKAIASRTPSTCPSENIFNFIMNQDKY